MNTIFHKIATVIIGGLMTVSSLFGFNQQTVQPQSLGAPAPQFTAAKPTYLYGGGISSSDVSIKLTALVTPNGTPITTAQLVGSALLNVFYATIEPSTNKKETISCTGVTQNGDGTAVITGCTRGLQFTYPYTASSTLAIGHSGGSAVVLSNSPQVYNDIITYINNATSSGAVDASVTAKGLVAVATANQAASNAQVGSGNTSAYLALTTSIASSTRVGSSSVVVITSSSTGYIDSSFIATSTTGSKFGGTGVDAPLIITSGTTTIDLGGASTLIKNYASISITGTGALAFTNAATSGTSIILKSQGAVTLTSSQAPMISTITIGAKGGTGDGGSGNPGTDGYSFSALKAAGGANSLSATGGNSLASSTLSFTPLTSFSTQLASKYFLSTNGGGGGSGAQSSGNGGSGGRGGGSLIIESGGAFNFTTANGISVAGQNGFAGTGSGSGGAGGGAGTCFIVYSSLVANSGTITVTGGTGNPGGGAGAGGNGQSGYSLVTKNTEF